MVGRAGGGNNTGTIVVEAVAVVESNLMKLTLVKASVIRVEQL